MWQDVVVGDPLRGQIFRYGKMAKLFRRFRPDEYKHPLNITDGRFYFNPVTGLAWNLLPLRNSRILSKALVGRLQMSSSRGLIWNTRHFCITLEQESTSG